MVQRCTVHSPTVVFKRIKTAVGKIDPVLRSTFEPWKRTGP